MAYISALRVKVINAAPQGELMITSRNPRVLRGLPLDHLSDYTPATNSISQCFHMIRSVITPILSPNPESSCIGIPFMAYFKQNYSKIKSTKIKSTRGNLFKNKLTLFGGGCTFRQTKIPFRAKNNKK